MELFYCLITMVLVNECFAVPLQNTSTTLRNTDDSFLYASDLEEMQGHSIVSRTDSKQKLPFSEMLNKKGKRCIGDLCDGFDDYPHDEINKILAKNPAFSLYFSNKTAQDVVIEERFGDDTDKETLCFTKKQSIEPQKAKNINDLYKIVINTDKFRQTLVAETCSTPGNTCRYLNEMLPYHNTQCTQKHIIKRLWTIDPKEPDNITEDQFFIPSCCICELHRKEKV